MSGHDEEDFAAMFEASLKATRLETGQTVEGTIVAIGPEVAFVDVGSKGEATIALDELKNDDGMVEASVGDRVQATIVSLEEEQQARADEVRAADPARTGRAEASNFN